MSSDDWDALWRDALEQYRKETGSDPPVYFAVKEDISIDDILAVALDQKEAFDSFRSKGKRLRKALDLAVYVIQTASGTAAHVAKMTFRPAEAIFSGIVVLLRAAEGLSEKYDRIAEMLEDLDDILLRVKLFPQGKLTPSMKKLVVKYLSHILVILGLATKAIRLGRGRAYFKTLLLRDTKVKDAFEKLDRLATREGLVVASATLSATNEVLKTVEEGMGASSKDVSILHNMILAVAKEAASITENAQKDRALLEEIRGLIPLRLNELMDAQLRSSIHIWLGAPNPNENQSTALKKRTPGTGAWLMDDERYLRWKTQGESKPLWLYGKPGAGKTVLSSAVVKDIEFEQQADTFVFCAYFYFDFRDGMKQKCRELLVSIIEQLAFGHPDGVEKLETAYKQYQSAARSQPTLNELIDLLRDTIEILQRTTTRIYIIVDAVDECTESETLLGLLRSIAEWKIPEMSLLVSSRRDPAIDEVLLPISVGVDLETSVVDSDIGYYVEFALQEHPKLQKWRNHPTVPAKIRKQLSEANGMFRWAFCQLDTLSRCINAPAVYKALRSLPGSLNETYERILLSIDDEHSAQVIAVLQWLAFSERPMTLLQIVEVLAIDFDDNPPVFSKDNRPPDSDDIFAICASLITINTEGHLELAHFSVKEYLMSSNIQSQRALRYRLDPRDAHTFIARCTLAYLLYFSEPLEVYFPDTNLDDTEGITESQAMRMAEEIANGWSSRAIPAHVYATGKEVPNYPLALYAAQFWDHHSSQGSFIELENLILSLFGCSGRQFQNSVFIYDRDRTISAWFKPLEVSLRARAPKKVDNPSPLYYAAFLPNQAIVAKLMVTHDINERQKEKLHDYPLQAAAFLGNEAVVKVMLEKGADVNVQGGHFGNALQGASHQGREDTAKMLLESGADINALGGKYGTALQAASFQGHKAIVDILLEKGANVNAQGGYCGNALQAATEEGHETIVELLLKKGANVNAYSGGFYCSALQVASCHGHKNIVELLLQMGADVNVQGGHYSNALYAASSEGYNTIVELLLENGGDLNVQGGFYGNALQAAAYGGHEATVELLLENGADVNAKGGYYDSALRAAAESYCSPTKAESRDRCKAILEMLLKRGADMIKPHGERHGNVLSVAERRHQTEIVELLLNLKRGVLEETSTASRTETN